MKCDMTKPCVGFDFVTSHGAHLCNLKRKCEGTLMRFDGSSRCVETAKSTVAGVAVSCGYRYIEKHPL